MKRTLVAGLLLCASVHVIVQAQQAGSNVGVLPIVTDPSDPSAYLKGDLYLQRQLEPAIAVSTRNPQTLIAFFNDYRAVDVPTDLDVGEGSPQGTWTLLAWVRPMTRSITRVFARLTGRPSEPRVRGSERAAAEAWVGMSRSFDGGKTWVGGFLPGAPFDTSPASVGSPIRNTGGVGPTAATDPVVAAAPCGQFYVAFIAFNRGADSKLAVAKYVDDNNREGGDNIRYLGTTVVDTSNNASQGQFLDKPSIAVDISRTASPGSCAHNVYVAYTQFTGNSGGKFQSSIMFARSSDGGATFTKQKLSNSYPENQGTAIAVDPRPGTPTAGGGGTVYVIWRHFFDPDTMVAQKSTDYGQSWLGKGARVMTDTMQRFDQPTQATSAFGPDDLTFRSNAFPTATVTPAGVLLAAWQERVNISPGTAGFGRPAAGGSPRIVLTSSANGLTWSARAAVDMGDRDVIPPAAGAGLLPQGRASGPQVMPALSTGGGRVMLAYYESRGFFQTSPDGILPADTTGTGGYIAGMSRLMDVRAAVLDPSTGAMQGTAQVSRYPIKSWADLTDGEQIGDVLAVNMPCSPDFGPNLPACIRRVNRTNVPHSASGTSPFIGDYLALAPAVQFVFDGTSWRYATAADVPSTGFHAAFADNRNQIPPTYPADALEWQRYPNYAPPSQGGSCINPGSRNTDVLTSRVSADLVVTAPTTFKQLGTIQRAFPLSVSNGTGTTRFYQLSIVTGAAFASFSQTDPSLASGDIQLFPYSGSARVVYVAPNATGQVTIKVQEITGIGGTVVAGGLSGTAIINMDSTNPAVSFSDPTTETHDPFVQNPFVQNPFVQNPFVQNPFVQNTSPSNPFVQNPFVQNPFVQNTSLTDAIDVTWTVQNIGNTASTYLATVNVDNALAYVGSYAWQLIIWKQSSNGTLQACNSINEGQAEILANVVQDPSAPNPFVQNPFVQNPFVQNPFVQNPFVQNATFAVAPPDTQSATAAAATLAVTGAASTTSTSSSDDGTTKMPRPQDEIKVTLRAIRVNPNATVLYDPVTSPPSLAVVPQSRDIIQGQLQPVDDVGYTSPDLVVSGSVTGPSSAAAGTAISFPANGFSVYNQGNANAASPDGNIRYGIYLSTDATITAADTLLGTVTSTQQIAAGQSIAFGAIAGTIPANIAGGQYYIGVLVDDQSEVSELNETNNYASIPIAITANTPPVATDQSVTTLTTTPVAIVLSAVDAQNDPLTYSIVTPPANGTLSAVSGASVTYTPAAGFFGSDAFTFKANDGRSDSAPATVSVFVAAPALALQKTASPTTYVKGTAITYTYAITNTGNASLVGPFSIADDKLGTMSACGTGPLAPGASTTCTSSYTTTQADMDAGLITNNATASAAFLGATFTSAQSSATVTANQVRALALAKSANLATYSSPGQVITYAYVLTNTGNVTLAAPFSVSDDHVAGAIACGSVSLAPGATSTCSAGYAVTQADLDSGSVTNHATATNGATVSPAAQVTVIATQTRSLLLAKTANRTSFNAVGQAIGYTYVVKNGGNVTLAGPFSVSDDHIAGAIACGTASLAPAGTTTCSASYAVTQADLDAGSVTNRATATNGAVTSNQAQATVAAIQAKSLLLAVSASPATYNAAGNVISYSYAVTNTGNVTLAGPLSVSDSRIVAPNAVSCPAGALAPAATATCAASYTVTQADVDGGSITDAAVAAANGVTSNQDGKTVTAVKAPAIALNVSAAPLTYSGTGQAIAYTYVVTNTGNVTLSGTITVNDTKFGAFGCGTVTLAPAAAASCAKSYTTVQADIDNRSISNTATASLSGVASNSITVTVNSTVINGRVVGGKYYDSARNGIKDGIDPGFAGWRVNVTNNTTGAVSTITTASDGSFTLALLPGSYTLQEVATTSTAWRQTGNITPQASASGGMSVTLNAGGSYTVLVPTAAFSDASGVYFGNSCTVVPGGQGIGFWTNKNAVKLISAADLQALRDLPLVNDDGTPFDPTTVSQFQTWLNISATGQNMADQLSGQLAALQLNLRHGYTKPNATIDGTRTTTAEVSYVSSLLLADPLTASGDPNRTEQSRVMTILSGVNSNQPFVQTLPDACPAPTWK